MAFVKKKRSHAAGKPGSEKTDTDYDCVTVNDINKETEFIKCGKYK